LSQSVEFRRDICKSIPWIAAAALLVIVVRLFFVMVYRGGDFNPNEKMTSWSRIALNVATGHGYVYDSDAPTARRGPVPVLFIALLFSLFGPQAFPGAIVASQWLWDAASAVLIYSISMHLFRRRRAALLAMAMFAVHPVIVENSVRVNVEPLGTCLFLAFVLTVLYALRDPNWGRFIWPGIFLGLSILSLAILQFFPIVVIGLIVVALRFEKRRILAAVITFCLSLFAVWSPWIIRNYVDLGAFVPTSTSGGLNLLEDHYALGETDYLRYRGDYSEELESSLSAATGMNIQHLSEVQQDHLFRDIALGIIRTYPDRYIILSIVRFFRLWFNQELGLPPDMLAGAAMLANAPLMLLAGLALLRYRRELPTRALLIPLTLIYVTVFYMAAAAELRFSVPFIPFLIILSAYAVVNLVAYRSSHFGESRPVESSN